MARDRWLRPTHPAARILSVLALALAVLLLAASTDARAAVATSHHVTHAAKTAIVATAAQPSPSGRAGDISAVAVGAAIVVAALLLLATVRARAIAREATVDSIRTRGPPRDAAR
jgi:hypothetical protein